MKSSITERTSLDVSKKVNDQCAERDHEVAKVDVT